MQPKVFVDTNILLYAMDNHDPAKRDECRSAIKSLHSSRNGVVSTQVLQEFYVAATTKLKVDPLLAKSIVSSFENFEVVVVTPGLIKEAIDISILNRISFCDALILASADSAHCERLWTEDMSDGQTVRGVRIESPLSSPRRGRR